MFRGPRSAPRPLAAPSLRPCREAPRGGGSALFPGASGRTRRRPPSTVSSAAPAPFPRCRVPEDAPARSSEGGKESGESGVRPGQWPALNLPRGAAGSAEEPGSRGCGRAEASLPGRGALAGLGGLGANTQPDGRLLEVRGSRPRPPVEPEPGFQTLGRDCHTLVPLSGTTHRKNVVRYCTPHLCPS